MSGVRAAAAVAVLAMALAGCMGGAAGFLQVRPERLYERQPLDPDVAHVIGRFELRRSAFAVFGIPFSSPNVAAAIESRVQESDADAITNLEVAMSLHTFFFVFGATRYDVSGDLVKFEKANAK